MINIAICDDNAEFTQILQNALCRLCGEIFPDDLKYTINTNLNSGKDVLRLVENEEIDVLFLDIVMPEMNGLELAGHLLEINADLPIIFVSGYDQLVYEVFEFHPFAFLRKEALWQELPKILKRIAEKYDAPNREVELDTVDGKVRVNINDILCVCSNKNYYEIIFQYKKSLFCRGTLQEAQKYFDGFGFFRIHAAYLVNLQKIQWFDRINVYLGEKELKVPIAQRRLAEFKKAYALFTRENLNV